MTQPTTIPTANFINSLFIAEFEFNYGFDYYQRNYSWGKRHVSDLVRDIWSAAHSESASDDEYYLGNIILSYDPHASSSSQSVPAKIVVDGQQRLTSVYLLLALLYRTLDDTIKVIEKNHSIPARANGYRNRLGGIIFRENESLPKFRLNHEHINMLMNNILSDKYSDFLDLKYKYLGNRNKNTEPQYGQTIANMYARYKDMFDTLLDILEVEEPESDNPYVLSEENFNKVIDFTEYLLHKVYLVKLTSANRDKAYAVFMTQNDRGLSLFSSDLIKAMMLEKINSDKLKSEAKESWDNAMLDLQAIDETKGINEFFRDYLRSQYATKAAGDSYDQMADVNNYHRWVADNCSTQMGLKASADFYKYCKDTIPFFVKCYKFIFEKSKKYDPEFENIFFLSQLGYTPQIQATLYLSALNPESDESQASGVLKWHEKLKAMSRYWEIYVMRRVWSDPKKWRPNFLKFDIIHLAMKLRELRSSPELIEKLFIQLLENDRQETIPENLDLLPSYFIDSPNELIKGTVFGHFAERNNSERKTLRLLIARLTHHVERQIARSEARNNGASSPIIPSLGAFCSNKYELEHILPSNYHSEWSKIIPREDWETERWKLGALLVIPKNSNNSYLDSPYSQKLSHYKDNDPYIAKSLHVDMHASKPGDGKQNWRYFLDKCKYSEMFAPQEEFGKDAIQARTRLYQEIAKDCWKI